MGGMRVNIGCGATPTAGWTNIDNSLAVRVAHRPIVLRGLALARVLGKSSRDLAVTARLNNIEFADAVHRIPFPDKSVDVVYSAHMIEHLDRQAARRFLREVRRVLRPGGIVRIAAPDLSLLAAEYLAGGDADTFVSRTSLAQERPRGLRARVQSAVVGPRHHLWMYDGDSLSALLRGAGFTDAAVLPPGDTGISDPGALNLKERAEESVYVEAGCPG